MEKIEVTHFWGSPSIMTITPDLGRHVPTPIKYSYEHPLLPKGRKVYIPFSVLSRVGELYKDHPKKEPIIYNHVFALEQSVESNELVFCRVELVFKWESKHGNWVYQNHKQVRLIL